MDTRDRKMVEEKSKMSSCFILTSVMLLIFSIFIARSPFITLNKPMKANYIKIPDFIPYEGKLAPNDLLTKAKYIGHKNLRGPETIVFSKSGIMYTGLMNGQIVRLHPKTDTIHKIITIGTETNDTLCNDYGPYLQSHASCGFPLGLRFHPDKPDILYVADAYFGIIKVDVIKATKETVISSNDPRFKDAPMKFCDDVDIDGDIIYFVDTSYQNDINKVFDEFFEAVPHGRLFSFNEKTNELDLIAGNLYLPNGMQLMPNKNEILINEITMSRIIKINLKGGSKEVFVNLPGHGDTIRLTDKNTLLVPFCLARHNKYGLHDLLGEYPALRSFISIFLNFHKLIMITPKYGLVVEYDLNGNVLRSWHDPSGKTIELTTNAVIHDNKMYLGSFQHDFIGVLDY